MTKGRVLRSALGVLLVSGGIWAHLNRHAFDADALPAWLEGLGLWAAPVFVVAYAAMALVFVPGSWLTVTGGAVFGPIHGTYLSLLGATVGATLAFIIARYFGAAWVARRARGRMRLLLEGVEAKGWRFVALVNRLPVQNGERVWGTRGHRTSEVDV